MLGTQWGCSVWVHSGIPSMTCMFILVVPLPVLYTPVPAVAEQQVCGSGSVAAPGDTG